MKKILTIILIILTTSVYSQVDTTDYYQVDLKLNNGVTHKLKTMDTEYLILGTFLTTFAIMNAETLLKQGREKEAIATAAVLGSIGMSFNIIGIHNLIKKQKYKNKQKHRY